MEELCEMYVLGPPPSNLLCLFGLPNSENTSDALEVVDVVDVVDKVGVRLFPLDLFSR